MENITTALLALYQDFSWLLALGILCIYVLVDGMYAYYTLAVTNHRAFAAATSSALMHFLLALGVLSYIENALYVIPIAIGSWFGTFIIVRKEALTNFVPPVHES